MAIEDVSLRGGIVRGTRIGEAISETEPVQPVELEINRLVGSGDECS